IRGLNGAPSKARCEPGLGEPYTDEETEYLRAIDDFRRRTGKIPTLHQGFQIALTLGWARNSDPCRKARWTVCSRGHELTGNNVEYRADGRSRCKTCANEFQRNGMREYMRRRRALLKAVKASGGNHDGTTSGHGTRVGGTDPPAQGG